MALPNEVSLQTSGPVIDCDVFIGRGAGSSPVNGRDFTSNDLLNQMDYLGIDMAVVYHVVALEHAPIVGNELLLNEVRSNPRLIPAFVLLPTYTHELPPMDEIILQMREEGVRMARIFPSSGLAGHRFPLKEWCIGPMLSALEEAGIALGIDFSLSRRGEPPWNDVFEICEQHPDLRIALMDVQGRNNRAMYALMERFPHLYISSGGLNVHTGLEDMCGRFGAERIFFGSGSPTKSMGAARLVVDRAALDNKQQAMILGSFATDVLGLIQEGR